MQIAIDTSTNIAGLALMDEGKLVAELTWNCRQNHSAQLLSSLSYLLEKSGMTIQSADCIIVARGPGSYNGLRVGLSTAKGIAFSLDIPLIGISTLEAEAWQHAETGLPVCPVLNAGREEIATALYRMQDGEWLQLVEEHLSTVESLCSEIKEKTVFCGEFLPSVADELKERLMEKAVIVSPVSGLRRAGFLAELGLKRFGAGDYDNPTTLQPSYFRGPPISSPKPGKKSPENSR
ncbi:tRNA (adenosine(37)-N6)-threonylcarbamoyltransferase complex dimerization subunit type 1 TsaB, partial [Chloroflexota bacterium]